MQPMIFLKLRYIFNCDSVYIKYKCIVNILGKNILEYRFHFFTADIAKGAPKATEHEEIRWVTAAELAEIPMCPADERVKARLIK